MRIVRVGFVRGAIHKFKFDHILFRQGQKFPVFGHDDPGRFVVSLGFVDPHVVKLISVNGVNKDDVFVERIDEYSRLERGGGVLHSHLDQGFPAFKMGVGDEPVIKDNHQQAH